MFWDNFVWINKYRRDLYYLENVYSAFSVSYNLLVLWRILNCFLLAMPLTKENACSTSWLCSLKIHLFFSSLPSILCSTVQDFTCATGHKNCKKYNLECILRLPGPSFTGTPFLYHMMSGLGTPFAKHASISVLLLFTSWFVRFWVSQGCFLAAANETKIKGWLRGAVSVLLLRLDSNWSSVARLLSMFL